MKDSSANSALYAVFSFGGFNLTKREYYYLTLLDEFSSERIQKGVSDWHPEEFIALQEELTPGRYKLLDWSRITKEQFDNIADKANKQT